jgi:RNA polymerase sigma-70 factor (ECF subfamily)
VRANLQGGDTTLRYTGGSDSMAQRVTELLLAWGEGDQSALNRMIPLVHAELRYIAARYMARERLGHTLQPTALVNEVYLRLVDVERVRWQNRAHFLAVAARLMRRILVDFARSRRYQKRGGGGERVAFDEALVIDVGRGHDLLALDDALDELARVDDRQSQIVVMRFFAGLTVEEIAGVLGVSTATVMRDWKLAKTWLLRELDRTNPEASR